MTRRRYKKEKGGGLADICHKKRERETDGEGRGEEEKEEDFY